MEARAETRGCTNIAGFCIAGFPIQPNPYPPAPPPPPPPPTPATVLQGSKGQGTYQNCPVSAPTGLQVGDLMVAFVGCFNELGQLPPTTMAGQMPAGWTLFLDAPNAGIGSLHGPIYAGIAIKFAAAGEYRRDVHLDDGNARQLLSNLREPGSGSRKHGGG